MGHARLEARAVVVTPASSWAGSSWAEAVFHVLAHVDAGRLASSCHDPGWIAYAGAHFGPASQRELSDDAALLSRHLNTHDLLARAQSLAWLWTAAEARAQAAHDLASLFSRSPVRASLLALGPAAEVLRAAAELELALLESLPPIAIAPALSPALASLLPVSPTLASCSLALIRPLPRRGRLHDTTIAIGVPGVAGATTERVAWQAAHEATVLEVQRAPHAAPLGYADLERRALALLRARARRCGLGEAHARWLATLDLTALGPIPDVDDAPD